MFNPFSVHTNTASLTPSEAGEKVQLKPHHALVSAVNPSSVIKASPVFAICPSPDTIRHRNTILLSCSQSRSLYDTMPSSLVNIPEQDNEDRKSTRLNSSHVKI